MSALDSLALLRSAGHKPPYVMIDLVPGRATPPWRTTSGAVHIEIPPSTSLSDLDCRALVGLYVHLGDRSGRPDKLRKLSKLAAQAKPFMLAVFTDTHMHRLWADGRSDGSAM